MHEIQTKNGDYIFSETPFHKLMRNRIHKVLLVCSSYDAFTLEEDGRIEEQLFNEYIQLSLHHPPQIIHAATAEKALKMLNTTYIDIVITMLNVGEKFDAFEFAKEIKKKYSKKPVVVLTPFSREVTVRLSNEDLSGIDYVFSWLGQADIMLAIVKLLEDSMNVEQDVKQAGVHAILLVEDSVRYTSSYLPNMYKIILTQAKRFMREGLNAHKQMLRMRGRPKIILAKNYEEANELYSKFKNNILGIISDTRYPRNGHIDDFAGVRFLKKIKKEDQFLPMLLQSSDKENIEHAKDIGIGFIHKYSETLSKDLRNFMNEYFAFGAFKFRDPDTWEVLAEAADLKDMHKVIEKLPIESLVYHTSRNHISKWLNARALFPIAELIRHLRVDDFPSQKHMRKFITTAISGYRKSSSRGLVAKFNRDRYDDTVIFSRIGEGSLGGKARGLAFLDLLIKRNPELELFDNAIVCIPRSVVISTEIFDEFMDTNNLDHIAYSDASDEEVLKAFVNAKLPQHTKEDLKVFLDVAKRPLAIRSSSILEDSHYQPFAGVYATYMIPNYDNDEDKRLSHICQAIKGVYASVYYKQTKAYMHATSNLIDEEKMGVVLQEVCGTRYENRFYPTFSGVARSINFYPIELEQTEDGIAQIALGLGKHIVEGKKTLRFSPKYPQKILQLSSPNIALRDTQKQFSALDLTDSEFSPHTDDGENVLTHRIKTAEADESIYDISSVYDYTDNILREGKIYKGKRIITFANVLKYNSFPLADILQKVLSICQTAMNNPVEIEFAVDLNKKTNDIGVFNLLQIRPIVADTNEYDVDADETHEEKILLSSDSALGNGIIKGVQDIVYVKPETFNSVNNPKIVPIIEKLNDQFRDRNENYILVGPGRWGSSDHWLGIPVQWTQISQARLIVEAGLKDYTVDPSQGTHFFQNLTSFRVGYFTINPFRNEGMFDISFMNQQPAIYEDEFVRHIRFDSEMLIKIDGKKSKGIILKPE